MTNKGLMRLIKLNQELHSQTRPVRVAFLVASDLAFGIARMGAPHVHDNRGENMLVCREEEEALAWVTGQI